MFDPYDPDPYDSWPYWPIPSEPPSMGYPGPGSFVAMNEGGLPAVIALRPFPDSSMR